MTREKKWTQGDWYVVQYSDGWYARPGIETDEITIVVWGADDDREGVLGASSQEAHANATLMVAAPKLVEALEGLVAWADGPGQDALKDLERARSALAQAYGEDQ